MPSSEWHVRHGDVPVGPESEIRQALLEIASNYMRMVLVSLHLRVYIPSAGNLFVVSDL